MKGSPLKNKKARRASRVGGLMFAKKLTLRYAKQTLSLEE